VFSSHFSCLSWSHVAVKKYKVHGLPTFMVVKAGEVLNIQEGAMGKAKLVEYVETHLPELKA